MGVERVDRTNVFRVLAEFRIRPNGDYVCRQCHDYHPPSEPAFQLEPT